MGFIKGKAFPIVNTLAKKGNIKAKNLLLDAPKLEQEKVDNIVAELLGHVMPIEKEVPPMEKLTEEDRKTIEQKSDKKVSHEEEKQEPDIASILLDMKKDELETIKKYTEYNKQLPTEYKKYVNEIIKDEEKHAKIFQFLANGDFTSADKVG